MSDTEDLVSPEMQRGQTTRRSFLAGAAGLTGVALTVGAWKPVFAADTPNPATDPVAAQKRVFTARVGIELEGQLGGFLFSAEGGHATSDVVNEKIGPDHLARKHIAGVKYEDIAVSCGTGMSKAFYDWVKSSFSGAGQVRSGSVVGADFNLKVFTRTDFFNALISEVGMPALDAASKDAAKMTVKFSPEFTRAAKAAGSLSGTTRSGKWLPSNFKLTIGGLDTSSVSKIDAIVIKQDFNAAGVEANIRQVEIPNLKITLGESRAIDFVKWHEDFVIKGNNSRESEKQGSLSYLAPDLKTELFRLDLFGLGIFALDADPLVPRTNSVRHVTAQLYCDKIAFSFGPAVTA